MADGDDVLDVGSSLQGIGSDQDLVDAGIVPQGGYSGGMFGNIKDWISNNPLQAITAAGGAGMLGYEMFGPPGAQQQDINQLSQAAAGAGSMSTMLSAPVTSGVLPPGAQQALKTSEQAQEAQQHSSYAKMGMAGSTGEADAISAVKQRTAAMQWSIEDSMLKQAAQYAGLQSTDLQALITAQRTKDQDFANALGKFVQGLAGAFGGSGGGGGGASA